MSHCSRIIIRSFVAILALVGITACGAGHASPSTHQKRSLPITTHNTSRQSDRLTMFPRLQFPLSTSRFSSNAARHVIQGYWQDFREIGEKYSVAEGELQAYHLLSPTLREHLSYSTWQASYRNVHLAQLLTLYPVSAHKFYIEVALWYVHTPDTQSLGYENGFMTVNHDRITSLHLTPENLLGTVFRIQAWPYTLSGVINEALHVTDGSSQPYIVKNTEIAPNIFSVKVRYQHHVTVIVVTREANRMYAVLSTK